MRAAGAGRAGRFRRRERLPVDRSCSVCVVVYMFIASRHGVFVERLLYARRVACFTITHNGAVMLSTRRHRAATRHASLLSAAA